MTDEQFLEEYSKLVAEYPQQFSSKTRRDMIFETVAELPHKWWVSLVRRIIISNNPRLDIADAARGEINAISSIRHIKDLIDGYEGVSKGITEKGLDKALNSLGAKSLLDAIFKNKEQVD